MAKTKRKKATNRMKKTKPHVTTISDRFSNLFDSDGNLRNKKFFDFIDTENAKAQRILDSNNENEIHKLTEQCTDFIRLLAPLLNNERFLQIFMRQYPDPPLILNIGAYVTNRKYEVDIESLEKYFILTNEQEKLCALIMDYIFQFHADSKTSFSILAEDDEKFNNSIEFAWKSETNAEQKKDLWRRHLAALFINGGNFITRMVGAGKNETDLVFGFLFHDGKVSPMPIAQLRLIHEKRHEGIRIPDFSVEYCLPKLKI